MMEYALSTENLRCYHRDGWEGTLNLKIAPGERVYIQGNPGRSNLLFELLTGLREPNSGTVEILGKDLYTMTEAERIAFRREHMGAIPESGGFLPELSLLEQIILPMNQAGLSHEKIRDRIHNNTFNYLPLHSLYNPGKRCRQRTLRLAALLGALLFEPPVLIFHAAFESLTANDTVLVWQEAKNVLNDGQTLIYLGSGPEPGQMTWTRTLQIQEVFP